MHISLQEKDLSEEEVKIYERQIQDPTFGMQGQRALKGASVMISRVGGLGGTVAMELAKAGVGRLVLAHDGVVEYENLNRMHLAFREDLGKSRVEVFKKTLKKINPQIELITVADNVNAENVTDLVAAADIVVDAAPLFEERYVMNKEIVKQNKPMIFAGMYGLEGYVSTILPGETPCLSCIFPEAPKEWNLRIFPVITPSPVLIATVASMEVIKLITNTGETLANILLHTDLLNNTFHKLAITQNNNCSVCSV